MPYIWHEYVEHIYTYAIYRITGMNYMIRNTVHIFNTWHLTNIAITLQNSSHSHCLSSSCVTCLVWLQHFFISHCWPALLFNSTTKGEQIVSAWPYEFTAYPQQDPCSSSSLVTDGNWALRRPRPNCRWSEEFWPQDVWHTWPTGMWICHGTNKWNVQLWANSHTALCEPWERKRPRVNPYRKSTVEPLRWLEGVLCHPPATPSAVLASNCIGPPFPLVPTNNAEKGPWHQGSLRSPYNSTQTGSTLERSLQWCHKTSAQHREWQLLVISSLSD